MGHVYDVSLFYQPDDVLNRCIHYRRSRRTKVNARIKKYDGKPITGWKKSFVREIGYCIIELLIPANATRYQPENYKCRASRAKVLGIYSYKQTYHHGEMVPAGLELTRVSDTYVACSLRYPSFKYEVGKVVKPVRKFDKNFKEDCASGIHFFLTKEEAINFVYN